MMVSAYFYNEAPAIGCGWRRVIVEREGRIWVRLINPHTLAVATVRRKEWEKIRAKTVEASKRDLRKKGLRYIETVRALGLGKPEEVETRVKNLETRLRRALKAL